MVCIDGNNPFIKWQMERGLDWTISSVAGESYSVDVRRTRYSLPSVYASYISPTKLQFLYFGAESDLFWCQVDLTEPLESWAAINIHMINDKLLKVKPVWRDASFTLKYHSDALFDFPHWFGFSKRKFNVSISFL